MLMDQQLKHDDDTRQSSSWTNREFEENKGVTRSCGVAVGSNDSNLRLLSASVARRES